MMNAKLYGEILSNYVKAGSQNCSPELLETMARSEIDRIRLRVAENPGTPIGILELLSTDKNVEVRIAVGTNPSTPTCVRYQLALDQDLNVRLGLADDMNTPIELLERLTEDGNPYVSHRAMKTIQILQCQRKPGSIGHAIMQWANTAIDQSEFRYA